MSNNPATPAYIRKAVKKYDQKVKKLQMVVNMDKEDEAELYEAITADSEAFSRLAKRLLKEHYSIK